MVTPISRSEGEGFRCRQTADVGETVAHPGAGSGHSLDVADAILESDEIGATIAETAERHVINDCIVPVIDDHA